MMVSSLVFVFVAALTSNISHVRGFVSQNENQALAWPSFHAPRSCARSTALPVSMFGKEFFKTASDKENGNERRTVPSTEQSLQAPLQRDAHMPSKFASGDELFQLRDHIVDSKQKLVETRVQYNEATSKDDRMAAMRQINELEKEIHALNERDAEFVYALSSELMANAKADMNARLAEKYRVQMEEARLSIPHLNMHGLWVGK